MRRALAALALAACGSAQAGEPYLGEMRAFAFSYCPKGWAMANGQLLSIPQNSALYALVGVAHGGNGSTTVGLPDLRGRTPVGTGISPQGDSYALGQRAGLESVTLTTAQMPAHTHMHMATTAPATHATPTPGALLAQAQNAGLYVDSAAANTALPTGAAGDSMPVATRDPYLAITWCVALTGVWPPSPN